MKSLVWILVLALAIAPCSFAASSDQYNLPELGQAGGAAISQAELDEIGEHILTELRSHDMILQDPLVTDYIRDVGHRIASHSDSPETKVHYYVMNTPAINSFALPGGNVFIFTGLLLMTDNENELAGVIAHETAHVTQHHIARSVADSQGVGWKELAGIIGGLVLATATGNPQVAMAAMMGTQAALIQHQINFTRHDEAEADRMGIGFMARAGYNPDGMAELFEKMDMMARGEIKPPAFLVDHPLFPARITDASQRARQLPNIHHKNSRGYLLMKARARVLTAPDIDKALAWFNAVKTDKLPQEARNAIAYGRVLCFIRLNRVKDALAIAKPLLEKHPDVVAYHLAVANAELQRNNFDAALTAFAQAQRVFPDSLAVKLDYAQALLAANRPGDARNILETAAIANAQRPDILRLLAQSSSEAGATGEGRYYMSQYYELNGRLVPAINQIQLALNAPHVSEYEKARYEARLDDLKQARKEQIKEQRSQLRSRVHFGVQRGSALPFPPPSTAW